ncbi:MAG: hypothetical protein J6K80_05880 [Oscillospiraceae bacterium]|nr:hypothetical protein [Oscillospiraceae bacterium]
MTNVRTCVIHESGPAYGEEQADEYKYAQNTIVEDTKATFTRFDFIFSESIKTVDYAQNIIVIKCHTAMAQAACEVFDNLHWEGVVGTLAGENTIFIVVKSEEIAHNLCDKLRHYIK